MIEYVQGDLLSADVDALINTVNTVGVMGKGIALQFKQAFPKNFKQYEAACKRGDVQLGRMFVFDAGQLTRPRYIINFPTKGHWRARSRIRDIEAGLVDLHAVIEELGINSIALPPLGCGNGGLRWDDVRPRIEKALSDLTETRILIFEPIGAPKSDEMKVATAKPRMTRGRAVLLKLLDTYLGPAAVGASPIEIQKLMYFVQEAGEPLKLSFTAGRYGPYAENLNHVLQQMEGHYLRGYGDRSAPVLEADPISLVPGVIEEADAWLAGHPESSATVDRVLQLTRQFQSPYEMELLASLHWIATRVDARAASDPKVALEHLQSWSERKGRLFTAHHVEVAMKTLLAQGWTTAA